MRVPSFHAFRCGRASVVVVEPTTKLWSWGSNNWGQLGLGNTTNRSSPVQVGALTDWSKIAGGGSKYTSWGGSYIYGFFSSIKTDGTEVKMENRQTSGSPRGLGQKAHSCSRQAVVYE